MMTNDNTYGATTGARSPEYDDGLTHRDVAASGTPVGAATMATPGRAPNGDEGDLSRDETGTLISADKVVGTAVYDAAGERVGTIDSIMLDKRSGRVAYAVMSFGGFLGIGERYHPLPWDVLRYDNDKGGYNVQHSADDLRKAPNYSRDEVRDFDYGQRSHEVDDYYGVNVARGASADRRSVDRGTTDSGSADALAEDASGGGYTSRSTTGIEAADAIGSTTGAGSSGMGSTGMGANRNF